MKRDVTVEELRVEIEVFDMETSRLRGVMRERYSAEHKALTASRRRARKKLTALLEVVEMEEDGTDAPDARRS